MRHVLVLALGLLPAAGAVGDDRPIPQDVAKIEKRRLDRLEYYRRTMQGAYDKVGKKDPRWDKPAREALELAAKAFSREADPEVTFAEVHRATQRAIDAGCDDPYLDYLRDRTATSSSSGDPEGAISRSRAMTKALAESRYPACRRAVVLRRHAGILLSAKGSRPELRKEAERNLAAALGLLAESVAKDERNEFWETTWYEVLKDAIGNYRLMGDSVLAAQKKIDDRLAKLPELAALRLQFRGAAWMTDGWDARTTAFAAEVPAGGFERLEKSLVEAKKAYEEAWKVRPGDARTAICLIDIDKSTGGDRATMELWFDRAMKADGDARDACWAKLDWLDPKWHGTAEEMLAFGRRCRDTKNSKTGITLLYCDAERRYRSTLDPSKQQAYLGTPAVWPGIKEVFEEYLRHHPSHADARSKYAAMCLLANHPAEAHAQFEILGDKLSQWTEFPFYPLETLKQMRAQAKAAALAIDEQAKAEGDRKAKP